MAEFQAGEVVVPVVPSADGFLKTLKKQIFGQVYSAGAEIGKELQRGISDQLKGVYEPLKEQTKKQKAPAQKDGAEVGGAFASGFKKRLEAALKSLPKVELDADASEAQRRVQELRAQMATLADKKIGVDIDAAAATAELRTLQTQLKTLEDTTDVQVRADVTAALTQLAALDVEVTKLETASATVEVDADAAGAQTELAAVEVAVARVDGRTANVRVDVDAVAALAQLGMVSAALAAMPAVAALGLGAGGLAGAAVAAGVGVGALAAVAVPSLQRISEATKANEAASKAAQSATASAAGTAQQAAISALNMAAAEERVVDAKRAAKSAEEDLTRARQEAKRAAEDLNRAVTNSALSQEDAALAVREAEAELERVRADPKSTDLQRERAELAHRQAVARLEDEQVRGKRLAAEKKAADKAGIEGSKQVVAARDKIAQANKRVEDAERALKVMQLQSVAAAKQQAAAQRGTVAEMVKLSPAAAKAARQIGAFKDAYLAWQTKLEPAVLPAVTGGLKVLQGLFAPLTPVIKGVSGSLVGLEKDASKALGGSFWQSFFKDLSTAAPTAVTGLGKSLGNVTTGVAGMIKAFLPFVPTIVGGIEKATAAFSKWGQGLGKSSGFQTFINYAKTYGPMVWQTIKNLAAAGLNLVKSLAPLGGTALAGISGLASAVAQLDPQVLQAIVLGVGGLAAGIKVASTAMTIFNAVMRANPIGLIITAIGLLVAALVYAYQNSETFRNIVQAAFQAISAAISWAWENVIQPAMTLLVAYWKNVLGPVIAWLWENVVKPAWDAISKAIQWAWQNVILPAVTLLVAYWKNILGPVILWLWEKIIQPAFKKIGEFIAWAWNNVIKPAVTALRDFVVNTLAPKVLWFHDTIVKPVFKAVGEAIAFAWEKVIKPAFSALWTFISETVPNGFKKGVELIGKFWDGLKEIAKKPVNFVIETVYNNGIVKLWNTVADALGLKDMKLTPLPALATGGVLPGYTPGRDTMVAAVSGGEAVMRPEWTRAVGSDFVHQANAAARHGGVSGASGFMRERFAGGFATGGIIGDVLAKGVKVGAEAFLNPILDQAAKAMGGSQWGQMLTAWPKKMVADVVKFLEGKEAAQGGAGAGKALAFARAQIGKPYQWGGTGPGSFDCSGLTMRAWQAAGRGDIPRTSQQQMGWVKQIAKPVPGALGFPHPGHVWLYASPNTIVEAPQTGLKVREVAARAAQLVGVPPATYDSGGFLPTGHSLVYNGTGAPERVLTDQQWDSLAGGAQGGDGPMLNVENFHATPEQSPSVIARELYWLSKSRPR
ncbi:NlpC/P60 family protein [Nonomuraea cavernae]|uniref:NlpC/P60 domain-containing protein n=1 Tax=Nonomuraea cavernae TaxID=2045107 RepID=A0A918DU86_9ACTN|nr:NlpC/P60 family protein [Nonomuraea cavernae]MCA2190953.1 NlpC/P60 family protein [Nonomuraea cavernae]GGO83486.1 hypothetical protein GCM10012289_77050 [Nonomuraea cavernae]